MNIPIEKREIKKETIDTQTPDLKTLGRGCVFLRQWCFGRENVGAERFPAVLGGQKHNGTFTLSSYTNRTSDPQMTVSVVAATDEKPKAPHSDRENLAVC